MKNSATKSMGKRELTTLERDMRNLVVIALYGYGMSVTSIARIMSMTPSTVSRLVDNKEEASE